MNMKQDISNIPQHVGIILDGNRRFARKLKLQPWKGHKFGADKLEKLFEWCEEYGIKELTLYSFSMENFKRPKKEVDFIMNLIVSELNKIKTDPRIMERGIKMNFVGRTHLFPKNVQKALNELTELTKNNNKFQVNFLMAYGGRAEIIDATKKIIEQVKKGTLNPKNINEKVFSENLYLKSEPDLIIRTSENRLSGFLTWQGVYAELIFLPNKLWPEFEKKDFVACLKEYSNRKRRFGN